MLTITKKGRIPNDAVGKRPFRFGTVRIKNCIAATNLIQLSKDWVLC